MAHANWLLIKISSQGSAYDHLVGKLTGHLGSMKTAPTATKEGIYEGFERFSEEGAEKLGKGLASAGLVTVSRLYNAPMKQSMNWGVTWLTEQYERRYD